MPDEVAFVDVWGVVSGKTWPGPIGTLVKPFARFGSIVILFVIQLGQIREIIVGSCAFH